jgi:photosystem II stability/assembly factor-like uncharacterized protein
LSIARLLPTLAIAAGLLLPAAAELRAQQEEEDHARRRWEWFYQMRAFPFGTIPAGALERARGQMEVLRRPSLGTVPPISGTTWQPIGPRAIPTSGTSIGRISAIAVHPTDGNTLYIGGAQGGVWRTSDGGATWTPLTDKQCSLAMGSIALDPVNPSIVYAGTGEQHFSADSYYGCGVLRSLDGGNTWTRLGATVFVRGRISRMLIVPSTAGTVATTTIFAASDNGLFRSTDGGANWTLVRSGIATDFVIDPTDDRIVYTAIRQQGVFRSANRGTTWEPLGTGFATTSIGRINIAIVPSSPTTLYASVANLTTSMLNGIWRTIDSGVTWTQLAATGASCSTQCWYDMYIAVHPTNPNQLYFGGVSMYRSLDGGTTFSAIGSLIGGGAIHVDQHYLTFDPRNPQRIYAANDGGIYRSDNAGTTWASLNAGLELTQFYSGISLHPSERTIVLGGTQDNGTLRYSNSPTWAAVIGGDGGFTAINPDNPAVQFGETQWTTTSQSSGPRRSDGAGFIRKVNGIVTTETALFIPPLVMDPSNPSVLYFGTNRLYRTRDAAESWTPISPLIATTGAISSIAPAATDPNTIYVGTSTGNLMVTRDSGIAWTTRTTGLPTRAITDIAVDRADPLTAYVTVSGFGGNHVFRTVNAGQSWSSASGNLPDLPVNAVLLDPVSRAFVLVGTDLGVFVSADSGSTWTVIDDGMPNVAVFDLAYNPATASLVAATHGRGMFQLQLNRALTVAVVPRRRKATVLEGPRAPFPDSAAVVLSGTGAGSAAWTATHRASWLTLTNSSGTIGSKVSWTRNSTGLAPGIYVDTITVTSAGAIDSPVLLLDSLIVESAVAVMSLSNTSRRDTASAGTAPRVDSVSLILPGSAGARATWTARARKATWIAVLTPAGTGSAAIRWTRNPTGLTVGVHVDTIAVTSDGAIGSPALVVDSLVILPLLALNPSSARDTVTSGSTTVSTVTRQLTIGGDPTGTVDWTVRHGVASWITIVTPSGRGNGPVSWTRSAANLRDGLYIDTITVTAGGARIALVDSLVVTAPTVTRACAAGHLFGASCLDAVQLKWLDLAGNRDGQYNLGDLVAFLSRGGVSAAPARRKERR